MLSSNDIASMFASQQSQFAAQGAFAQQITANAGIAQPPNNSLANWGSAPAQAPRGPSPFPNVHPMPPAFSYNPAAGMSGVTQGYGGGNRFASGAMSAAGAMGAMGSLALGFTPMAGLVDPIAGGMAGFAAGGVGGAMAGAALPLALGYGASKIGGAFIGGGQQRMQMNETLGQNFGFMNPASRTGQGFNRNDVAQITGAVKGLAETPELLTSFKELNEIIPKLRGSGVFSGVRDAHEFNTRFKESVKTLRDMSKILGSTMEEAAAFFQQSRQVGFTSPASQKANALNVKFTSAMTGMSTDQVFGMQQAGAGMASQMGIRRGIGARAVTNVAQQLQGQIDTGALDQGLLEDLSGGATGDEAMGGAAANITGALAGLAKNTSFGKQSLLAITKFDETGRAVGIDKEKARRLQEGSLGWDEQKKIVGGFNKRQKMSAMSHMDSLSMEYAGSAGMAGFASQVGGMRERGFDDDAIRLELTRLTGSENMSGALMQMEGKISDEGGMGSMMQKLARDAARKERRDPKAILAKIKTKLHKETLGKIEEVGGKFFDKLAGAYDDFWDDVFEDYSISLSKEGGERLKNAFNATGEGDMKQMFADAQGAGIGQATLRRSNIGAGDIFGAEMGGLAKGAMRGGTMAGGMFGAAGAMVGGYVGMQVEGARTEWKAIRESELAASLTGGRTEGAQYRMQMSRFAGGEEDLRGLTDEAADRAARMEMKSAQKFGAGLGSLDQANIRGAVARNVDEADFYGMSAAKRYEKSRDVLATKLGEGMYAEQGMLERAGGAAAGFLGVGSGEGGGVYGMLKSTDATVDAMKSGASYAQVEAAAGGRERVVESLHKQLGVSKEDANKMIERAKDGKSFIDSVAAQVGFGQDAADAMGGFNAQAYNASAEQRSKMMKDADSELTDKLGGAGAAMVKARPKFGKLLMSDEGLKELNKIFGEPDEDKRLKMLSDAMGGQPVTRDELETLRTVSGSMNSDTKEDMRGAIEKMGHIQNANDLAIHRDGVKKLSDSITGTGEHVAGLKSALNDFSKATTGEEYQAGRAKVGAEMEKFISGLSGMSDEKREEAIRGLGTGGAGEAVRSALGAGKALQGKSKSEEELTKFLRSKGVTGEEAEALVQKYGGTGPLGAAAVADIEKSVGTSKLGAAAVKDKGMTTGDIDTQMLETMKDVQKSIDLNTTVILNNNTFDGDLNLSKGRARLKTIRDNQNTKENPGTPPVKPPPAPGQ